MVPSKWHHRYYATVPINQAIWYPHLHKRGTMFSLRRELACSLLMGLRTADPLRLSKTGQSGFAPDIRRIRSRTDLSIAGLPGVLWERWAQWSRKRRRCQETTVLGWTSASKFGKTKPRADDPRPWFARASGTAGRPRAGGARQGPRVGGRPWFGRQRGERRGERRGRPWGRRTLPCLGRGWDWAPRRRNLPVPG